MGSGNYAAAITNNGTLRLASTASQTLSGNITGSGSVLSDSGAGDLTLSGTGNDFTGDVGFSASGTRSVTVASLGNGSGNIRMFQNNQFHTTASITTTKGLVLGGVANVSQNIYADAGTLTINGVISDNAAISGAAKVYFRSAG